MANQKYKKNKWFCYGWTVLVTLVVSGKNSYCRMGGGEGYLGSLA